MENKLVSMTDFVLNQRMTSDEVNAASFQQIQNHIALYYDKVFAYATFLKQPLTPNMFVPMDDKGNVIEKPSYKQEDYSEEEIGLGYMECDIEIYEKAKENVLFDIHSENIEIEEDSIMFNDRSFIVSRETGNLIYWRKTAITIEDIANDPDITFYLTKSALGLWIK